MRRKLRIYLPFITAGVQEATTYKVNFLCHMVGSIMNCFISYFIWSAVYSSGNKENIEGFTMPQMVVYIFLMFLTSVLVASDGTYNIGMEVRDGSIAMRLIKPVSYNSTFLCQEIGYKIMGGGLLIIPLIVGVEVARFVFTGELQFNALRCMLYFLSTTFAYLISFFFNICFGFIAFVIKYVWGADLMKNCIVAFLSGAVVPLAFLPEAVEKVFLILPFASLSYTPVMIYLGRYTGVELVGYILLQFFWVFAFWLLSKLLWKITTKHLSVQGG